MANAVAAVRLGQKSVVRKGLLLTTKSLADPGPARRTVPRRSPLRSTALACGWTTAGWHRLWPLPLHSEARIRWAGSGSPGPSAHPRGVGHAIGRVGRTDVAVSFHAHHPRKRQLRTRIMVCAGLRWPDSCSTSDGSEAKLIPHGLASGEISGADGSRLVASIAESVTKSAYLSVARIRPIAAARVSARKARSAGETL
jgi:hypothetical protein